MNKKKEREKRIHKVPSKSFADGTVVSGGATSVETTESMSLEQKNRLYENAMEFARFSFELEEKREQSLINQSIQMLTAFAVTSVALLMAIPVFIECATISRDVFLFSACLIFILMLISMAPAMLSRWRFKYRTMIDGKEFLNHLKSQEKEQQWQYDWQWIDQLSKIQRSKKKNNDIQVRLIKISMIAFFVVVLCMIIGSSIIAFKIWQLLFCN